MAYSYFETTVSALESAKRTVSGVDYYDLSYLNLDYTPLFSTTQVDADKYVSDVGDTLQVTLGENTLDRSSNTDLWIVNPSNNRVEINTSDSAWTALNPQNSDIVRLSRISKKDAPYVDYANAAVLTEQDLDAQAKQSLHIVQESIDIANDGLTLSTDGKWDGASGGSNRNIKNVATPSSSDPSHYVATKGYVDGTSSAATVASISDEITTVAGISSKVETVAGAIKETIAYTVDVANSVFRIQGGEFSSATEKPTLNLQRGSTYTFNYTHSSISSGSHVLGFSSANTNTNNLSASPYTDGVTNDTVNKIITFVVPSSAPDTLYYYCTAHNAMGNTMNIAEDSVEVVADNITNVNKVGAIDANVTTVAGIDSNVTTVAGIHGNITTVATLGTNGADVTTVAGKSTEIDVLVNKYDGSTTATSGTNKNITQVDTVADSIASVNSVANNLSSVSNFGDTYHPSIDANDTSRSSSTAAPGSANTLSTLTEGDLWFDSVANTLKVYDGSSWGAATSSISTVASTSEFTASDGQGTGNKFFAFTVDAGLEIVWLNGVKLKRDHDYHLVNSNTDTGTGVSSGGSATFIRMETVPSSSDVLSVMGFGQISNNLAVNVSGGTFTGNITVPTPTASGHAVTKDYVDNNTGAANEIELSNAVTLSEQTTTYQKMYLGNTFTVGGNLTVNGNLVLGKIIADSTGQTLSGSGYTITGTGQITMNATLV